MAKRMAKVADGVVVNVLWCSETQRETEVLKDPGDRSVGIGDSCRGGKWYHGDAEILTELEIAQAEIEDMRSALNILGVNADG